MSYNSRTIFAPATLVGESGITVIRISGEDSFPIASNIFSVNKDSFKKAGHLSGNSVHHGFLFDGQELIDEVVITSFKAPNSFTGEDVIEISSHGGYYIFHKINRLLLKHGTVHAEPGEFSKRAFLNGKIDLAQAKAVADIIRANTEHANKIALKQL